MEHPDPIIQELTTPVETNHVEENNNINPDDFHVPIDVLTDFMTDQERAGTDPEPRQDPGTMQDLVDEIDSMSNEDLKAATNEIDPPVEDVKKKIVAFFQDSDMVVGFMDMFLSRALSFIPTSKKDDWKMDKDEKELFAKVLKLTVEEEKIEFWSMRTWFFVCLIGIYLFKGVDVWLKAQEQAAEEIPEDFDQYLATVQDDYKKKLQKAQIELEYQQKLAAIKKQQAEFDQKQKEREFEDDGLVYDALGRPVLNKAGEHMQRPGRPMGSGKIEEAQIIG